MKYLMTWVGDFNILYAEKRLQIFGCIVGYRFVQNRNYRFPKVNKAIFKHSIAYLGPKYFNLLPLDIKNSDNLKTFCKKSITWLSLQQDISYFNLNIS